MKRILALFAIVALVLSGCSSGVGRDGHEIGNSSIYYVHDDDNNVCIWSAGSAIFIIPDSQLTNSDCK